MKNETKERAEHAIEEAMQAVRDLCKECNADTCDDCEWSWVIEGVKFFDDDYRDGHNQAYTGT